MTAKDDIRATKVCAAAWHEQRSCPLGPTSGMQATDRKPQSDQAHRTAIGRRDKPRRRTCRTRAVSPIGDCFRSLTLAPDRQFDETAQKAEFAVARVLGARMTVIKGVRVQLRVCLLRHRPCGVRATGVCSSFDFCLREVADEGVPNPGSGPGSVTTDLTQTRCLTR